MVKSVTVVCVFPRLKIEDKENDWYKTTETFQAPASKRKTDESTIRKLCHSGAHPDEDELTLKDDKPGEMGHRAKSCSPRDTDNRKIRENVKHTFLPKT